jgi:hypothetical protein
MTGRALSGLLVCLLPGAAGAAASFATSTLDDGVAIASAARPGDALVITVALDNSGDAAAFDVRTRIVLAACFDLAGFDPIADPTQVITTPPPATVSWDAASRTLEVLVTGPVAPGAGPTIVVSGLSAGPIGSCCQTARVTHRDDATGVDAVDAAIGAGSTCHAVTGCTSLPGSTGVLHAVRSGGDVVMVWGAALRAVSYNVWKVTSGDPSHIPFASRIGSLSIPDVEAACTAVADPAAGCSDLAAVTTNPPSMVFYRAWGACGDGSEGEDDRPSCRGIRDLAVSAGRGSIPQQSMPDGSCVQSGAVLPIDLIALATDVAGGPLANCQVVFWVDYREMSDCGRGFGEFCGGSNVALTDAAGVAHITYNAIQADFDACNCMPSGAACTPPRGLCPAPQSCSPVATCRTTPVAEDVFCQVAIRASAGDRESANVAYVEYGQ